MTYIVDIAIVALFVFVVVMGYKKGFLSTVIDTFALAISAVVSYMFCEPVAQGAYDLLVRDLVETRFTRVLDDISSTLSVSEKVSAMIEGLPPSAVKLSEAMGVNFNSLTLSMSSGGNLSDEALIELAVDKIGHPIMITVTEVITFIAMFVIITLALKFLAGVFKKANDIPLLGKLNAGLGGVIGIVKAVAIVFVACTAFYFIAGMSGAAPVIDAINNSKIYAVIIENNPIVNLIG
ncbi:MAG: CvpA family protein [Acutalibacteraceae bacterium]|nr:CvpA family protein [Acutalibacteraceae bacterium]